MKQTAKRYLQIVIYALLIVIVIFIMGITRRCGEIQIQPREGFSGGDTIDIAILYGPRSIYFYQDTLGGLNHDLANLFEKGTSTPVKIWPVGDANAAMEKMNEGAFDILASLPLDNDVKRRFLTSQSIFLDRLVLVQKRDSVSGETEINSSLDLDGKTVYVASGSPAKQRLANLSDEIGGKINIQEEPEISEELLCLQVANGTIPFAVVNENTVREVAKSYPLLSYENPVSFTQFQIWLFNPADSLLEQKFDEWFDEFRKSDSYRSLLNRY